jgi:hypothetical protein
LSEKVPGIYDATMFTTVDANKLNLFASTVVNMVILSNANGVLKYRFTMQFINKNIYSQGRGKISSFLNIFLHEFFILAPAIILIIFFSKVNILSLLDKLPPDLFHTAKERGMMRELSCTQ